MNVSVTRVGSVIDFNFSQSLNDNSSISTVSSVNTIYGIPKRVQDLLIVQGENTSENYYYTRIYLRDNNGAITTPLYTSEHIEGDKIIRFKSYLIKYYSTDTTDTGSCERTISWSFIDSSKDSSINWTTALTINSCQANMFIAHGCLYLCTETKVYKTLNGYNWTEESSSVGKDKVIAEYFNKTIMEVNGKTFRKLNPTDSVFKDYSETLPNGRKSDTFYETLLDTTNITDKYYYSPIITSTDNFVQTTLSPEVIPTNTCTIEDITVEGRSDGIYRNTSKTNITTGNFTKILYYDNYWIASGDNGTYVSQEGLYWYLWINKQLLGYTNNTLIFEDGFSFTKTACYGYTEVQ